MEAYLNENFGEVKPKHSAEAALMRWRKLCGVVKNPKRRFRFTADLSKRSEAASMRRTNQEKFRVATLVSKAALQFISGVISYDYTVPEEVRAAGFDICASELQAITEESSVKKFQIHGGVPGIAEKLRTSTVYGLTTTGDIQGRKAIYGINRIAERKAWGFWLLVWEALQDMTLIIDAICALVSLTVGILMEGWQNRAHDTMVIVVSISLVVFVTAANDYWQSLKFRYWEMEKKKCLVQVTRDGFRQKLLSCDLLPGDIIHITSGDQVPADGLFVSGFSVLIDESSLSGEIELRTVNAESPFLFSGTKVRDGSCKMLITAVGTRTKWGGFMETLCEGGDDETPLQVKLNGLATIIGKIGLNLAIVTFAVLIQGLLRRKLQEGTQWSWSGYDALEMFKHFTIAFTIFSISVPEGLPLAMTLSLAFVMEKMINDNALLKHMAACETMGTATTICTDKTGLLTTENMSVAKVCICMDVKDVSKYNNASRLRSEIPDVALKLLLQSILNISGGEVVVNKSGELEIWGAPTETALLEFGLSLCEDFQAERRAVEIVHIDHFHPSKKWVVVVIKVPGGLQAHCIGASEEVLAACDKLISSNGETVPLDEVSRSHLKAISDQFANEALRTLSLAYTKLKDGFSPNNPIPVSGYTCVGIVGIKDPVRPGVRESVAVCRSAGITVRMITDDSMNTAKAVARECGILTDEGIAVEGHNFREKSMEEFFEMIPKLQVIARSSPLDKHALVKHLRTTFNEVVAVTGGGTNDVPSLNEADIGLATGNYGTEVAKENADIIISDDDFSTIVKGVKWGRTVVSNIKKFVQFELTVNMVALILNISSAWLTGNAPFSDVELLWVSLITDTLGAFALVAEPLDDDLMKLPPIARTGRLINSVMWRNIFGQFLYQFTVIWFLQAKGKAVLHLDGPNSDLILDTFIFNAFIFCQVSNLISSRKLEEKNAFKGMTNNHVFMAVLGFIVLFQITIIEFLGSLANTSPLTLWQWFLSIFIGLVGIPIAAGVKMIPV